MEAPFGSVLPPSGLMILRFGTEENRQVSTWLPPTYNIQVRVV